ncbi:hypothetical protein [Nonomuraea guangzhouensis]|uniref:Uncharacterized protein n=1 Tax=Nonomuraea guangzhouensis TaxID=1291555 RepID=A0ABW4GM06_9ACTN
METETSTPGRVEAAASVRGRVALIGVPGLQWSDLDATRTPNLWKLVSQGGSASLSTRAVPPPDRGVTCPMAGWLTVSAGQRSGTAGRGCPAIPAPRGTGEGATVPGWSALVAYQADTGYDARLGTLGGLVMSSGGKVAAIGPGAALGAAGTTGKIAKYADTADALGDPTPYNLIVLDAPDLAAAWARQPLDEYGVPTPLPTATRQAAVAQADRRIGALLGKLPNDTTVLVAGISDITTNPHLHVAIATGPSPGGRPYLHGYLTATSTRQDALVTITDLTATVIQLLGLEAPREVVGRAWQSDVTEASATPADTVNELSDSDLASQVLREVRGPFFAVFVTVQLVFYAFSALALRRRRRSAGAEQTPTTDSPVGADGAEAAEGADGIEGTAPARPAPAGSTPGGISPEGAPSAESTPGAISLEGAPPAESTPTGVSSAETAAAGAGPAGIPSEATPPTGPTPTGASPGEAASTEAVGTGIPTETAPPNGPTPTTASPGEATPAEAGVPRIPSETVNGPTPTGASPGEATPAGTESAGISSGETAAVGAGSAKHISAETRGGVGDVSGADDVSGASGASGSSASGPVGPVPASASRLLAVVQVVAVVSGAIAVSTFLAQLVPWWALPSPMLGVIVTILAIAGLITGVAFAGPWRAHVLGPLAVVAGITSVALLVDVMTGSTLQVNAVTGYEPVTGGRFYGFSNIAFAVYSTGTVLGLAGVAQWLLKRGVSRFVTVLVCGAYGALAVFADGWPSWGADFGGVPAFVIGMAVFLILLAGQRVSITKLLLVGVAGGVLIGGISLFDWLRPAAQRTHLGNFVQQIIDGQAWTVVWRKFSAMIGVTVGNWSLTLLSLVALAFLFWVLNRPSQWGAPALGQAYALAPTLRAGLFGALTCAFIGFLINDSGIAIPAMALTVAVPLTLAASVRALQLATPTKPAQRSARAVPTGRSAT